MAVQFSDALRNAQANAIESTIGTGPTLEIRTGAAPANCAAADSGTLLVSMTLPSDWLGAASNGAVAKAGTWSGTGAAAGNGEHYRIKAGATCHAQGTVTATGGGGDLQLDNVSIASGQSVTISSWTYTVANG